MKPIIPASGYFVVHSLLARGCTRPAVMPFNYRETPMAIPVFGAYPFQGINPGTLFFWQVLPGILVRHWISLLSGRA
jgi:hypothetical protein